ncbi:bromodomain-containing protein 7-like [Branchiostoma lanceolatum]|uniref:bromodomain-containing protein 7-like n=1 Tax=Branchiostoma lanceolatum TaxID=7740 RepID=UPI00345396E8
MGKKHKKHHKSDRGERPIVEEKPGLKLVLKVSSGEGQQISYGKSPPAAPSFYEPDPEHHKKKKKNKKKKKKKKHSHEKERPVEEFTVPKSKEREKHKKRSRDQFESSLDAEAPLAKQPALSIPSLGEKPVTPNRGVRACRMRDRDDQDNTPLRQCLENLHRQLQRKDVNQFFAWPVTDAIAPGYSQIILRPMDFSTMKDKLVNDEYSSIEEFRNDFKVMCDNAMIYNHPETIYYKAAKKLLNIGVKMMSKDKIASMYRSIGYMSMIDQQDTTGEESGMIDVDTVDSGELPFLTQQTKKSKSKKSSKKAQLAVSVIPELEDGMTAEEITAQVKEAAKDVHKKLTRRCPNSKIGFLRRDEEGNTTLAVVNPDSATEPGDEVHTVNLGMLVGKLATGTSSLPGFREDKRNKVTPVSYLMYGPFGTHAPQYDSTFANLSKAESDLLLSTYGDEAGVQYAQSILSFVKDAGADAAHVVDHLLDSLTGGEHSKAMKQLLEKEKAEKEKKAEAEQKDGKTKPSSSENTPAETASRSEQQTAQDSSEQQRKQGEVKKETDSEETKSCQQNESSITSSGEDFNVSDIDFDNLKSLSVEGIDMSFLDGLETELKREPDSSAVQQRLDENMALIADLQRTQHERLSAKPPSNLSFVPGPTQKELQIAQKLTQGLRELTSKVSPADVTKVTDIRKAMGITTLPVSTAATPSDVPADTPAASDQAPSTSQSANESEAEDKIDKELREFLESPSGQQEEGERDESQTMDIST